ncbi:nucleotidyltransferase domain-containing protein [Paenibacillus agilis]|uniref:Nucleotidyltransferase domain-containing protein n=1 Tax=Paenibacillus agilis TaxID=3020863 RepID=A0A559J174_9BACL|nr:nucleotidyltransferase domain-containing protein [Paenibacillus agilis]TVX93640.1 nucleotidyltransferase domain-containing protein [Paenibacillus agilis]
MSDVQHQILAGLQEIENEERVEILYACESGSRAWGFPSKDSDYDVRFIYIRPEKDYLSLFEKRDVIERPISNMLDINGWDLKKALALFRKSNPPLLEWLQSPIVYRENHKVIKQIRGLSALTFSPKSCMYHYLHMAKGNYREYLQGEQVKIKKYFYVLRPLLACQWIERYRTMPPIEFPSLIEYLVPADSELYSDIQQLLMRKIAGDELNIEPRISAINDFLEEAIAHYEQVAAQQSVSDAGKYDMQLDELFRSTISNQEF